MEFNEYTIWLPFNIMRDKLHPQCWVFMNFAPDVAMVILHVKLQINVAVNFCFLWVFFFHWLVFPGDFIFNWLELSNRSVLKLLRVGFLLLFLFVFFHKLASETFPRQHAFYSRWKRSFLCQEWAIFAIFYIFYFHIFLTLSFITNLNKNFTVYLCLWVPL